ncbi:MAG: hypothetical protein ABW003_18845, partial [Microvirga sp.]
IEAYGFQPMPGDIDARVLVEWMDPSVQEDPGELEDQLIELLTRAKADGDTEFRLTFGDMSVPLVPES